MKNTKYETLNFEKDDSIGIIKFNRNHKINALNMKMLFELYEISQEISEKVESKEIKGLVITGNENGFASGLDLEEFLVSFKSYDKSLKKGRDGMRSLEMLPIPTISAVNRAAVGGGLEIALTCDFIYSEPSAKFGFPEVRLGLIPGAGGTVNLPKRTGYSTAKDLIYSGKIISAEEAQKIGLVDKITKSEELLNASIKYLKEIGKTSVSAVGFAKKSITEGTYKAELDYFQELKNNKSTKENIRAYLQKL